MLTSSTSMAGAASCTSDGTVCACTSAAPALIDAGFMPVMIGIIAAAIPIRMNSRRPIVFTMVLDPPPQSSERERAFSLAPLDDSCPDRTRGNEPFRRGSASRISRSGVGSFSPRGVRLGKQDRVEDAGRWDDDAGSLRSSYQLTEECVKFHRPAADEVVVER